VTVETETETKTETDAGGALVVECRRAPPAVGEPVGVAVDAGSVVAFTAAGEPLDGG